MSYYPVFIPMMGGGGPTSGREVALILVMYAGVMYAVTEWLPRSSYQMKLEKNGVIEIRRSKGFGHNIPPTHMKVECLHKKGYTVCEERPRFITNWAPVAEVYRPATDIKQILADCKECGVYTEVRYTWDDIFNNERQGKQRLYWHKSYKPEMA